MYQRILNALKDKYKNLGLGDTVLAAMAKQIEAKIKEESEIAGAVDEVEPLLKSVQSDTDRRVTDAQKAAGKTEPTKADDKNDKGAGDDEKAPKWAQGLIDDNAVLRKEIAELKGNQTFKSRQEIVADALKGASDSFKDVSLRSFNRMKFEKDDDFNAYLDELKADVEKNSATPKDDNQENKPFIPFGGNQQNGGGGGTKDKAFEAADKAIEKWANQDKAPEETKK